MHEMIRLEQSLVMTALLLVLVCWMPATASGTEIGNISVQELSSQPVQFIKNVGQVSDGIQYQAKSQDFSFDFTNDGMLISGTSNRGTNENGADPLVVTLEDARTNITIEAINQLPGYANFLKGQNESDYKQYVPWYGEIRYPDILPGINLTYSGKNGVLKREYQVRPGADPKSIQLAYKGAELITRQDDGSLLVQTKFGNLTEAAPVSYQEINGSRSEVSSQYSLLNNGTIGFIIGAYDPAYPLIIDPYLKYSTYLSGSYEDYGMDVAMDTTGDAYVVGYTSSCDFPLYNPINVTSTPRYNGTYCHGNYDVFVTKLNTTSGNATIEFSTYIGGEGTDYGRGIAIDSSHNMYITGETDSTDFPMLYPIQGNLAGSDDAYVSKIRSDGANFAYSTYLGGNFADLANDIALDSSNAAYITGITVGNSNLKSSDENFPVTSDAYQTSPNTNSVMGDAFISKISPAGSTLQYSSYISGNSKDEGNGIAVDTSGLVYLVGTTTSNNLLPSGATGMQKTLNGTQDAYVFKMDITASSPIVYATYLGGSTVYDYGQAIATDTSGCAYVTGYTSSTNFPVTPGAKQKTKANPLDYFETDAFVTKYNAAGTAYVYSTFLGGTKDEQAYDIKVDSSNRAYVTGYTKSKSFPKIDSIKATTVNGNQDGFLTCVNAAGSAWVYSTAFGGYDAETSHGVAVSSDGNASVVTGWTKSPSILDLVRGDDCTDDCFPVTNWINQTTYPSNYYCGGNFSGGDVAIVHPFVMKFNNTVIQALISDNGTTCGNVPLSVSFYDHSGNDTNILERIMSYGDGTSSIGGATATTFTHTYTTSGVYHASLTIRTASSSVVSDPITISACNPYLSAGFSISGYNNSATPIEVPWKTSLTFTGNSTNYTPSSWAWNFGDGFGNLSGQSVVKQFATTGTYTVTLSPKTGTCCNYTTVQKAVKVVAPPNATFTNITQRLGICAGTDVSFNDTTTSASNRGLPTAWEWNFGDNSSTNTSQNVTHTYSNVGSFTVSLTASNVAGSSTASKPNYVTVSDNVTSGFFANPVAGTAPLPVHFTDVSDGLPTAWLWDFGDASTSTLQNPTHSYTTPGVYSVSLNATNTCGSGRNTTWYDYITVNGNMTPTLLFGPNTSFLYSKYNGTVPLNVTLQGNTQTGTLIDKAWWKFGDGNTSYQERDSTWPNDNSWFNQTHLYSVIGDYTPVLNASNNTWPENTTTGLMYNQSIGVAPPMVPSFTVTPSSGLVTSQPITFTDTSSGSPTIWYWLFSDGSDPSWCSTVTHKFTDPGSYPVSLRIWNKYENYGGSASKAVSISPASASSKVIYSSSPVNMTTGDDNWRKVQLLLDRADYGLKSYKIRIELNNTSSAYFSSSAERPWWIDAGNFWVNASPSEYTQNLTLFGLDLADRIGPGSTNVSIGNISLFTRAGGNALISLNVSVSEAVYGSSSYISLSGTDNPVHVDVVKPLLSYTNSPKDLKPDYWHDGLVDDLDGNGVVNLQDVYTFMQAYVADEFNSRPIAPFDYYPDGVIKTNDIVVFFNAYMGW